MTMCGYISKDKERAWYQCQTYNISGENLQQGRLQHISAQTAIDDGKGILTQREKNSGMYKFSMRSLFPCLCRVRVVAMYALQLAAYISQALWKAAWNPNLITFADSDLVFYYGYSRPRNRERYFVTPEGDSGIDGDMCTPDGRGGDVASDEPCVTPRKRRCSPYDSIRRVIHQRAVLTQSERIIGCQPDFLEMTEATKDHYISLLKIGVPAVQLVANQFFFAQIS